MKILDGRGTTYLNQQLLAIPEDWTSINEAQHDVLVKRSSQSPSHFDFLVNLLSPYL